MIRSVVLLLAMTVTAVAQDRFVLVLNDPPAAATEGSRQHNIEAHAPVRARLKAQRIPITSETYILLNAIFVRTDAANVAQLRQIPGVRYVARVPRFHRSLDRAVQLINVPAAWAQVGGTSNAGAGIKIAIIDSGIDSTQAAFQDPTLTPPAGYPICTIAQQPFASINCGQYTNNKIIVARSYVPLLNSNSAATSRPDDYTPQDDSGHGTAVAMAAAGETNSGPADTITGVAPKAFLGSYKVFGTPGLNDFTSADAIVAALEDAYYNDSMDIAVLSLGAPALFGPADSGGTCGAPTGTPCDPEAAAVQNAVNAGMIVVVAAGNEGPTPGSIDSPADASGAIAVGAVTNSHNWSNPLTIGRLGAVGTFHSLLGDGPAPDPSFNAPLADATNAGDPFACNTLTPNSLTGTYAIVQRGPCTFATKVQNVQAAGAAGAIIVNNPGDDTILSPGGLNGVTSIPATFVGYDDGQTILNALPATASMNPALSPFDVTTGNQIASFSSLGPTLTGGLKPDIYAVGTDLYLPGLNGYLVEDGTSFATPQIAGIAALVKQHNPKLTPAQIRSAVVNSGAQTANAANALAATSFALPTSISFTGATTSVPVQFTNTAGQITTQNLTLPGTGAQGVFTVNGLNIPWQHIVGDGIPWYVTPIVGNGDDGVVGQSTSEGVVILQVTDKYGLPVPNTPVQFSVVAGGGSLQFADTVTDLYGQAGAEPILGPSPGLNDYFAFAGGLSTDFTATAYSQPTIAANGAVDAATFVAQRAVAPGSYLAIFGNNLAPAVQSETTLSLPVVIGNVSVSFDSATQSLPGHLEFVSPGQVNVQIPWELQGQASAQIKVSVQDASGALYTLPLAPYSPGIFAIVDENGSLVTASNPALQGHNIVIYANGLGPVTNQPASGNPSPLSPLAQTIINPTVTIGNQTAKLLFSGLTPTSVGLYQLNITVPATGSGAKPIGISIGGINSQPLNIPIL